MKVECRSWAQLDRPGIRQFGTNTYPGGTMNFVKAGVIVVLLSAVSWQSTNAGLCAEDKSCKVFLCGYDKEAFLRGPE